MGRFRRRPVLERLEGRELPTTLAAGFAEQLVVPAGLAAPTAMEFAPDGRLFVTEQTGALRVGRDGRLLATPFLRLSVDSRGERGLLGVAFDPGFATNGFVYVYYTVPGSPAHNRVSRFTADGDVAAPGSEAVILDLDPLGGATNHNGGAIHFGPDGKLYVAVGENARPDLAQSPDSRLGKMLRINADGSIPGDNPFANAATGANRAIWALGLRNPFTFAVQPGTGRIFINDVGATRWEEIDPGASGANYGWPIAEGPASDPRFVGPLFAYSHDSGGVCAIAGGAFYNPPAASFPADYAGDYFFADLCGMFIRRFDVASGGVQDFAAGLPGTPVDLKAGPDGALFYLVRTATAGGIVGRIASTAVAPGPQPLPAGVAVAYATAIYRDLLGRDPGAAERATAAGQLASGVDPAAVALGVINSAERRGRVVAEAYRRYLRREAGAAEVQGGVAALGAGGTVEGLEAGLLASAEYRRLQGRGARRFVNGLHGDVLGRPPTRRERLRAARAGLGTVRRRERLALQVLRGDEASGRLAEGWYRAYVGRGPTAAERAGLVAAVRAGAGREGVEASVFGSAGYRARFA